jgi:hypothetical protein
MATLDKDQAQDLKCLEMLALYLQPGIAISGGSAESICTTKIKVGTYLVNEIVVWLGSSALSELSSDIL